MTATIKTNLHYYRFDLKLRWPAAAHEVEQAKKDRADYAAMCARVEAQGFPVWRMRTDPCSSAHRNFCEAIQAAAGVPVTDEHVGECIGVIEIETKHLFNNQWNTAGLRVHAWVEWDYPNTDIKEGYWVEMSPELKAALDNTDVCGYCGKQEPAEKAYTFCPHCLDSEYLKPADLHLTRMRSVSSKGDRPKLNKEESAYLLPLYKDAQKNGNTERGRKRVAGALKAVETEYEKTLAEAKIKRDSALWILKNAPGFHANWIYYSHTDRHCFGWREKLDDDQVSELLEVISEFPFSYDIICANGRKLSRE